MTANTVTLSTGVVLRLKRAAAWALTEVQRQMALGQPKPPVYHNPDKGRDEVNEADPAYVEALAAHLLRLTERLYEVCVATGTEIVSLPEGLPPPQDDGWRDVLASVGIPLSDDPRRRYIEWVKYVAAPGNDDWNTVTTPLLRQVGTLEEDIAAAVALFRRDPQRGADTDGAGAGSDGDGDRVRDVAAGVSPAL